MNPWLAVLVAFLLGGVIGHGLRAWVCHVSHPRGVLVITREQYAQYLRERDGQ